MLNCFFDLTAYFSLFLDSNNDKFRNVSILIDYYLLPVVVSPAELTYTLLQ